jgi:carotenoid 1,2-hydratase
VKTNGYRWWYIDALSDDRQHGFTIIGFVGSVFSPFYRLARQSGDVDPVQHCAINVALYGKIRRWAMTEYAARHVYREENQFSLGQSSMRWLDGSLVISIDETCAPLPRRLRGTVIVKPSQLYDAPIALDAKNRHHWSAVALNANVEVSFEQPSLRWSGQAYHDMNWGDEPLEAAFRSWVWQRCGQSVFYDVLRRDGSQFSFGRNFTEGVAGESLVPPRHALRKSFWGMSRSVMSEVHPQLLARFEDTPFYTRNHVRLGANGETCEAMHESLSLDRFVSPIVQKMLPYRMRRVG